MARTRLTDRQAGKHNGLWQAAKPGLLDQGRPVSSVCHYDVKKKDERNPATCFLKYSLDVIKFCRWPERFQLFDVFCLFFSQLQFSSLFTDLSEPEQVIGITICRERIQKLFLLVRLAKTSFMILVVSKCLQQFYVSKVLSICHIFLFGVLRKLTLRTPSRLHAAEGRITVKNLEKKDVQVCTSCSKSVGWERILKVPS